MVQQGLKLPAHTPSQCISLFLPFFRQSLTTETAVELTASPAVIAGGGVQGLRVPTAFGVPGADVQGLVGGGG